MGVELKASPAEVPVYNRLDLEITAGKGVEIESADGRRFIDFYGGHASALLGYGHPALLQALHTQAETLFFQTNAVHVAVRSRAHEALVGLAPPGLTKAFLVNSGAEANENALRLAFRATGRTRIVAIDGAFHGRTAAAAAVTEGSERWYGFPRTPYDVSFVEAEDEGALDAALEAGDAAAVIVEPVQGVEGARALSTTFLRHLRTATEQAGTLLIADEIQCGMGRTGKHFAVEWAGVEPDILTTAKGLAGGFPAGAVLIREEVAAHLGPGDLGTTFGGGPLASALIVAVAEEISRTGFLEHVQDMGRRIEDTCLVGPVRSIQGRGLLRGLRCDRPAREVVAELRERGILVGTSRDAAVVRLMPPLLIQPEHVARLAGALADLGTA